MVDSARRDGKLSLMRSLNFEAAPAMTRDARSPRVKAHEPRRPLTVTAIRYVCLCVGASRPVSDWYVVETVSSGRGRERPDTLQSGRQ